MLIFQKLYRTTLFYSSADSNYMMFDLTCIVFGGDIEIPFVHYRRSLSWLRAITKRPWVICTFYRHSVILLRLRLPGRRGIDYHRNLRCRLSLQDFLVDLWWNYPVRGLDYGQFQCEPELRSGVQAVRTSWLIWVCAPGPSQTAEFWRSIRARLMLCCLATWFGSTFRGCGGTGTWIFFENVTYGPSVVGSMCIC